MVAFLAATIFKFQEEAKHRRKMLKARSKKEPCLQRVLEASSVVNLPSKVAPESKVLVENRVLFLRTERTSLEWVTQ